jgi:hypothetical protein
VWRSLLDARQLVNFDDGPRLLDQAQQIIRKNLR